MRPSNTMSFEQGLERGVPWGRDLFTFVTSAAGHMMRTLQRPRKNKPSKRQVNHRRFLHNMIQRKFAEIEAANQQLASALFSADASHSESEMNSSLKNESVKNVKKATNNSSETEMPAEQQDEVHDRRTLTTLMVNSDKNVLKSKAVNHLHGGEDSQPWKGVEECGHSHDNSLQKNTDFNCEKEQIQPTNADLDNLTQVTNIILEDGVFSWLENIERIRQNADVDVTKSCEMEQEQQYLGITLFDMSPTSPAVSPLSLDSCDFEDHMQPDSEHCSEMQQSLQMDVMENLALLESSEGYLQSRHHDLKNMDSAYHIQRENELSCFQDDFTFHYTSHEGYVMDNQADCDSGVITEGMDNGPHLTTFMESSVKDPNVELNTRHIVACGSSCNQNNVRYASGLTNVNEPGFSTTTVNKKEGQYSASWGMLEKLSDGSEQGNHDLDIHVLQSFELGPPNQSLTKYWEQHHVYKDTLSKVIEPYYVMTGAKNSTEDGCYGFLSAQCGNTPTQAKSNYNGDSCSYSSGEGDECIPNFEGVAQSFPAPVHKPHLTVSAPPLNDDWLFSNIVAEEDFNAMVRSPECTYC